MERTDMNDSPATGVASEPSLSTADVANASAPAVEERSSAAPSDGDRTAQAQGATGSDRPRATGGATDDDAGATPLFPADQADSFRSRWTDVQASFVDEPRQSVRQADGLVAEVIQQLAASFAEERSTLEQHWEGGGDVSTEDLRVALRRYRSFFDRLLSL